MIREDKLNDAASLYASIESSEFDGTTKILDSSELKKAYIEGAKWSEKNPCSDYAWSIYSFINEWKNGYFGEISLQEALDKHFRGTFNK